MSLESMTLEEIYNLEVAHPPLVGSKGSVFLEPGERSSAQSSTSVSGHAGQAMVTGPVAIKPAAKSAEAKRLTAAPRKVSR
jgi:hypothetical protein